jgi:acid ceramidase
MSQNELIVNLDLPPSKRWAFLVDYKEEVNQLLQYYLDDFSGAKWIFESVDEYTKNVISNDYLDEIEYISSLSNFTANEVLIANLYYDILKFYLGCTAFAVENNNMIYHSRNLDWHTDNNILSEHSRIFNFQRNGRTIFKSVGWLGFIGALSGIKPGKFSLTLNAVLSHDTGEIAQPVSFLLRDILDSAASFAEARERLESTIIASDCLILLSGTKPKEMVVIERTPKRFSTRLPENGYIVVTNDYKQLQNNTIGKSILQTTSCGRYDRTEELIRINPPRNIQQCFKILQDEKIKMNITVQQMVFENATGEIELIKQQPL